MMKRKINFDSIISLTSMKTSTSSTKPHQLEAKEAEDCVIKHKTTS